MEGDLQRTFGRNLRAYREAQGWSQQRLADTFGHDDSYTGGIERGERNMSLRVVERLCAMIGVEPLAMLTPAAAGADVAASAAGDAADDADNSDAGDGDEDRSEPAS